MRIVWIAAMVAALMGNPAGAGVTPAARGWWVCVSNERSGDVTVIDGASRRVVATISVGRRPRGLHASPDGKLLYVAVSGSPIAGPPATRGAQAPAGDDAQAATAPLPADRSADGIAVVDLARRKVVRMIPVGVDPEEFAIDRAGKTLVVANEDAGTASFVSLANGTIEGVAPVGPEPEGVTFMPDGRHVFVTSEAAGSVTMLDVAHGTRLGVIVTGGRP